MDRAAEIVDSKLAENNARNWTISREMVGGWLHEGLGRAPTELTSGRAAYDAAVRRYAAELRHAAVRPPNRSGGAT